MTKNTSLRTHRLDSIALLVSETSNLFEEILFPIIFHSVFEQKILCDLSYRLVLKFFVTIKKFEKNE